MERRYYRASVFAYRDGESERTVVADCGHWHRSFDAAARCGCDSPIWANCHEEEKFVFDQYRNETFPDSSDYIEWDEGRNHWDDVRGVSSQH